MIMVVVKGLPFLDAMHGVRSHSTLAVVVALVTLAGCGDFAHPIRPGLGQRRAPVSSVGSAVSFDPHNAVSKWNVIADRTIVAVKARPGCASVIDTAIVQIAVYDAVNAIVGNHIGYAYTAAAPTGASVDAAVGAAAYPTLLPLYQAPPPTPPDTHL